MQDSAITRQNDLKISFFEIFIWFICLSTKSFSNVWYIQNALKLHIKICFINNVYCIITIILSLRSVLGLYLLEMSVNLSQYRGSVGVFNNRNFFVQSKVSHFFHLSDINSNNNYNLAIGPLILLNKITLVLLLLNLMFLFKGNGSKHKKVIFIWTLFSTFVSYNFLRWLYVLLITLSGDVELNPGPKRNTVQTLSICHWNLNSICAHEFPKLTLLRAYVSVRKFDIICLSET